MEKFQLYSTIQQKYGTTCCASTLDGVLYCGQKYVKCNHNKATIDGIDFTGVGKTFVALTKDNKLIIDDYDATNDQDFNYRLNTNLNNNNSVDYIFYWPFVALFASFFILRCLK
jgi:hypothetical protein